MTRPFSDLITPRADGGLDILVDHPAGPLRWELPGERAAQLIAALQTPRVGAGGNLDTRLRSYVEPDDDSEDRAEIRALMVEAAEIARLIERRDALLSLVASISQTAPLASELEGWEGQRAALMAEVCTMRARVAELERENGWHRDTLRTLRVMLDPRGGGIGWADGKVLLAVRDLCNRDRDLTEFGVAVCREVGVDTADRSGDEHAAIVKIRDLRERVLRAETSEEEWEQRYDTALHDADEMRKAWEEAEQENEALRKGLGEALDEIEAVADDVPGSEDWNWGRFDELRKLTAEEPDGE